MEAEACGGRVGARRHRVRIKIAVRWWSFFRMRNIPQIWVGNYISMELKFPGLIEFQRSVCF